MKSMIKNSVLATAAASMLVLAASAAEAKIKDVKFHIVQTQFENVATMNMKFDGKNWNWVSQSKSFNTRVKVYFKASGKVSFAHVKLTDTGAGLWSLPVGYQTNKYEELATVTVGKAILSPFKGKASALCDVFGGSKKVVRQMDVNAQMSVSQSADVVRKNGPFPIRAVCLPKPVEPQRTPVEMKVSQLKLYTVPAKPVCGKPVNLVTEIWTNKPGKVEFLLTRSDGEKQKASVTTEKASKGYVKRWSKTYTYNQSIDRNYQVVLTKQAMASNWAAITLKCGAGADIKRPKALTK